MTAEDDNPVKPDPTGQTKQAVVFTVGHTGHNAYVMSCARINRDASQFTDVVLVCPDGNVTAHRLVLAAASTTLRKALLEVPANDAMSEGMHEHTILVPEVKKSVVAGLIDFLYTGKLLLSRSNARDMQLLVRLLGIDPENVRVEALEEVSQKRLKQTQLTSTMGLTVKQNSHTDFSKENLGNTPEEAKPLPLRASKRRASQESSGSNGSSKEAKQSPLKRKRSLIKPQWPKIIRHQIKSFGKKQKILKPSKRLTQLHITGYHNERDNNTWVCYTCKCYDPIYSENEKIPESTEWIGCDCGRWYHQVCTKLAVIDESSFSCHSVNVKCIDIRPE